VVDFIENKSLLFSNKVAYNTSHRLSKRLEFEMPRGVPKAGFRKTKNWEGRVSKKEVPVQLVSNETDDEIRNKLTERFAALEMITEAAVSGDARAVIISGPAGLGKSYGVSKVVEKVNPAMTRTVHGYVRPTGLYKMLYEFRHPGCVLVFDDADSIFNDDVSLNLLKAACDTTDVRHLSWLSEAKFEDSDGELVPNNFEFSGTVIFITNYDFDNMIERGNKLAPHFEAMISRSMYLDMAMKTKRDYMIRIEQVIDGGMLRQRGLGKSDEAEVMSFIRNNMDRMRELSLRMVIKVASLKKSQPRNWESLARVVCCR